MPNPDLLTKGDLIKSRWRIIHKIGGGGFGQIYEAYDKLYRKLVAVKVESNSQARQGIRMEVTVLRQIQNREHVCELLSAGASTLYNFMIMTLLGSSLSQLRGSLPVQCFTLSTSLRVSLQILEAIESVHSIGFLHRDIKPSNFAIGKKNLRQIFILDFGLARRYTDHDQHVRPARPEAGFRGTIRYASINSHNHRELGRHDDLWSFFYMLIEFLVGSLPWSQVKDRNDVGHMKETYDYNRFLTYLPDEFDKFLEHINELHYQDKPDYEFLRSLFSSSIQRLGYQDDDPYDWEKSTEQEQTDSLFKIKREKTPSLGNGRKTTSKTSINIMRTLFRSSTFNPDEQKILIIHHDERCLDENSHSKLYKNKCQALKSRCQTNPLQEKFYNDKKCLLKISHSVLNSYQRQTISHDFDRMKFDSIGNGDQGQIAHEKLHNPLKNPSMNTDFQHNTDSNLNERDQPATNGLLTYISQRFSNATAPVTSSFCSQWSRHHGEIHTEDDLLKGNKTNSFKVEAQTGTFSSERTTPEHTYSYCPSLKIGNNSFERATLLSTVNHNRKLENASDEKTNHKYYSLSQVKCLTGTDLEIPFGTYEKSNNT